jgi:ribonuclease PH
MPAKLSNCYTPLIHPSEACAGGQELPRERPSHALRQLVLETSIDASAIGSSLVELGRTKVLCRVSAPVPDSTTSNNNNADTDDPTLDQGVLICTVRIAPQASTAVLQSDAHHRTTIQKQQTDASSRLSRALAGMIPLEHYENCAIHVQVCVWCDDGGVLPASVAAATLALATAGVELCGMVACCQAALVSGTIVADPTLEELKRADAIMTLAVMQDQISLWEQSGRLKAESANEVMELCRDGCRTMHRFVREHLITKAAADFEASR